MIKLSFIIRIKRKFSNPRSSNSRLPFHHGVPGSGAEGDLYGPDPVRRKTGSVRTGGSGFLLHPLRPGCGTSSVW